MAPPKFNLSYWLLLVAPALAAGVVGSAASFAQATGGASTITSTMNQTVRTADFGHAATVLRKVAESGNAEAQYRLASLYRIGRRVAPDDLLAFKWIKAAAEQNHANAQFN